MRIFLAGASGAIGRRLVPLLIAAGHDVAGTTRSADAAGKLEAAGVRPAIVDVYDATALERAAIDARPEAVVHQLTDLPQSFDEKALAASYPRNARIRVEGTRNLIAAARAAGARRFDDRRHYVAWSEYEKEDFDKKYWKKLWGWYNKGGIEAVVAYLSNLDISAFDFKAPPPQTPAFWAIVEANRAPEEGELLDILDALGNPDAVTLESIENQADIDFGAWLKDRKNRRAIPHRMERVKYVPLRNEDAKDGLWKITGKRQVIYVKKALTTRDQIEAARRLQEEGNRPLKENEVREKGKVIELKITPRRKQPRSY